MLSSRRSRTLSGPTQVCLCRAWCVRASSSSLLQEGSTSDVCSTHPPPNQVERLGDGRQQVRQAACEVLLQLFSTLRADHVLEKMAKFWTHKNWRVRHGILQVRRMGCDKASHDALSACPPAPSYTPPLPHRRPWQRR